METKQEVKCGETLIQRLCELRRVLDKSLCAGSDQTVALLS